ncbi:ABC-three component system middle component 1 [Planococcus versutus]|uniref:Uncharacterized protein n=1 Tax=Planococcus versutus TaxID=1302659 RepID=A0A1B1RZH4_9BACL|nr:ABC-three component system middle component 1 [Planococcus versutus]ANU26319.1 hypothetical protein I858_004635 [Planococcus versutus]
MINLVKEILKEKNAIEIEKKWINLDEVYILPQGIFGLVELRDTEELENKWESCALELATKVQGRLSDSFDYLRWDIYLILFVNSDTPTLVRKIIENDRRFFKKIVINNRESDTNRLPFVFDFSTPPNDSSLIIHQESMFLDSLKNILPHSVKKIFAEDFFENGPEYESIDIYKLLKNKKDAELK